MGSEMCIRDRNSDMLNSALKRAIALEDYELASLIRDELNKRTSKDKA